MIKTYSECVSEYGSEYLLQKALIEKRIYKIETGVYANTKTCLEPCVIATKYPNAVFAGTSAFYYHGLTDVIPDKYCLATKSKATKIGDNRVSQIYVPDSIFDYGIESMSFGDEDIRIYDKERMLIELLRNKNSYPRDFYKEVLLKYRDMIFSLEIWRIQEYASVFPKSKMILKALDEEVM